ncbi:TetR/AcrR family transcriptional regulator [Nocardia sp. NBC_00511]|uniref:TetR/AcrR family transcriptional regulator n=1 Tax=Nocardia sp. NBC_00511 TaxID=2903591 RepID=UPI0030E42DC1
MPAPASVLRADARRNRALVLAAADRALSERGASVSLAEVARRAGVGAGTVYRHFPTKTALLEAVMQQRMDRLTAVALRLRDTTDPGSAFFAFCTELILSSCRNQALCDMLTSDGWPRELIRDAGERLRVALSGLLMAAQRQGAVRDDLALSDLMALYTGCIAVQRLAEGAELSRPTALILETLRVRPPRPGVTKTPNADRRGDETGFRNETAAAYCPMCAAPIHATGTGRPARYCSAACRQKAHRRRRAAQVG